MMKIWMKMDLKVVTIQVRGIRRYQWLFVSIKLIRCGWSRRNHHDREDIRYHYSEKIMGSISFMIFLMSVLFWNLILSFSNMPRIGSPKMKRILSNNRLCRFSFKKVVIDYTIKRPRWYVVFSVVSFPDHILLLAAITWQKIIDCFGCVQIKVC